MSASTPATLGIRREDKECEMRAPLTPAAVAELAARGLRVLVQPSALRIFRDSEYAAAGAELREDLSDADCVLGVKEVPPQKLLPGRTMMFFSRAFSSFLFSLLSPAPQPRALTPRARAPAQTCTRRSQPTCRCWTQCWKSACAS